MLSKLLILLKDVVNEHLSASTGWGSALADHGQVVFLESQKVEHLDFKLGAVTLLLVNLEEDHTLRPADPYRRPLPDGTMQRTRPPIHLNAYILFVARFREYEQSLQYISLILQYFQNHRVLDHESAPALSDHIEKLTMELQTLPFAELSHLWGVLRNSYQPSLLYKVRMVVFQDQEDLAAPATTASTIRISQ